MKTDKVDFVAESPKPPGADGRPTILLCDDETPIRQVLRTQLTARGYSVHEAASGEEAIRAVSTIEPDVVLLDLGLPDIDGIEVTRRLRQRTRIPIVVLSVRAGESDKIAALDAGADDYLTKPCQPGDLLERIRAALLRKKIEGARIFRAGDLSVDLEGRAVRVDNHQIPLTAAEYELLRVLVQNAGRLLTQNRLTHEVWGELGDMEALQLLRSTIGSLRRKLETDPARPRHIATEPGVGFRLRTEP